MPEIDNCPVCNTTCELEYGLEEAVGTGHEREVLYATCKTCKTRWRRREDPKDVGRLIYEKWACRIPRMHIPFPFVGGGIKLGPRWCRWVKVDERRIPVGGEIPSETQEETIIKKGRVYDERVRIKEDEFTYYEFELSEGDRIRGEIHSDEPVNVWFLDKRNFDKFERNKSFQEEEGTENVYDTKLDFEVPLEGTWYIVIDNPNDTAVEVKIKIYEEFWVNF